MTSGNAVKQLQDAGLQITKVANKGAHIMILWKLKRIDFWPATERWIIRGFRDTSGRGLANFIRSYLKSRGIIHLGTLYGVDAGGAGSG